MKTLFSPFGTLSPLGKTLSTIVLFVLIMVVWSASGSKYIPSPLEIASAFPKLLEERELVNNFIHSLMFCFKAIGWSTLISLLFCYISILPAFSTFCELLRKFRFLPSAGLSFLFMKLTGNIQQGAMWMMIFGVTTWLLDSMLGVALSISEDEKMYAKSLRLNKWQTTRELLIYGKAADLFGAVISNFAMAWMLLATIENMTKSNGGIGVVLAESAKYYKYDEVYATQVLILLTGIGIDYSLRTIRGWIFPYTSLKN